jgi:AAA15 family ATPase/GTPase
MLRAMTIENFKCFERLELADLGQFNLLTGRNNVGKSSLLEAMFLTVSQFEKDSLLILETMRHLSLSNRYFKYFFHNFQFENTIKLGMSFSENPHEPLMNYSLECSLLNKDDLLAAYGHRNLDENVRKNFLSIFNLSNSLLVGMKTKTLYPDNKIDYLLSWITKNERTDSLYLGQLGYFEDQEPQQRPVNIKLATLGSGFLEAASENSVNLENLLITPSIKKKFLNVLSSFTNIEIKDCQFTNTMGLMLAIESYGDEMVPFKVFGQGTLCFLNLVVLIYECENGILLVDEIDDGLHYSSMVKVWQHAMKLAKEHNVQLFATTHSMECVRAFSEVANQLAPTEARLININKPYARNHEALISNAQELAELLEDGVELT